MSQTEFVAWGECFKNCLRVFALVPLCLQSKIVLGLDDEAESAQQRLCSQVLNAFLTVENDLSFP